MSEPYKAAFILPVGTKKELGKYGWEFESNSYLTDKVENFLTNILNLKFSKIKLGIAYYEGKDIEASIEYDGIEENITYVYFQVYQGRMEYLKEAFNKIYLHGDVEFFIPSESKVSG